MCETHALELARNPTAASFAVYAANAQRETPMRQVVADPIGPTQLPQLAWTTRAATPQKREEGASAVLNGKLYVFGGYYDHTFNGTGRTDAYDPATNTWQQRASIPEAITHAQALVINGEAWLFGGYVGPTLGPATKKIHIYNPNSNTWRRGPDMPMSRGAGAAALVGNTVYVFGGRDLDRAYDMHQVYALNLATNTWSTKANLPNPRNHISGVAVDGKVYAVGGQWNEASLAINQSDVHRYDPSTNIWTRVASLPQAMSHNHSATFAHNGSIVIAGGETSHNVSTAKVFAYAPSRNQWTPIGDLPAARRAGHAGIINGRLIFTGGSIVGSQKTDVWMSSDLDASLSAGTLSAF